MAVSADAVPSASASLTVTPPYLRVDVAPGSTKDVDIAVESSSDAMLLVADADCGCLQALGPFPKPLKAHGPLRVALRVAGVLPGVKTLTLRTSVGVCTVTLDVVCAGLGQGVTAVDACLHEASQRGGEAWFLLPNLRGASRNCGCSAGSLGGIEHLAAFPPWCRARAGRVPVACLLLGDSDGPTPGLSDRLRERGWARAGSEAVLSATALQAVRDPQHVVVVPTQPTTIAHRALVPVPLEEGMLIAGVVVVERRVVDVHLIPVDASLPADAAALAWVPAALHERIERAAVPSVACQRCHAAAMAIWQASAHAHAFHALDPSHLTDACIACHSLPLAATVVAPDVHCQSCHAGAEAHVSSAGRVPTVQRVDCRSCHDARHHPGFDPVVAWLAIRH